MSSPVERVELAPGLTISRVVTGLWQIADMEREGRTLDPDATAAAMAPYVDAGFTTFDMADHYGSAEEIAGRCAQPVELATKWVPKPGRRTRDDVVTAVERALRRTRRERLDLLQYHAWSYDDPSWLDAMFWLQELRDEGRIRHLGVTNFDAAHLRMAVQSGIEIVSNQVCFSLLDRRAAGAMTELCLAHGIKLLAFGTLAGGLLTERWLGRAAPDVDSMDTWSQMKYRRFVDAAGGWDALQSLLRVVAQLAERHGVSFANVVCRHVLDSPAVAAIIVGARLGEREHLADNSRLFDFALDADGRAALDAAIAELAPIPGDCGDEYRRPPFLTASGDLSHHLDELPLPYPTREGAGGRKLALSGTKWEDIAGFARAVRVGDRILVSGTTATHGDRLIGGDDPAAQTHFAIDKIAGAIRSLGGALEDVVRTRVFIHDSADWEPVSRAHGERFGAIRPANTLVEARLIGPGYRVEIEAEAVVQGR